MTVENETVRRNELLGETVLAKCEEKKITKFKEKKIVDEMKKEKEKELLN